VSPGEYRFEPNLARAQTPPSEWYYDPACLAAEFTNVFARTWQLAGHADQVAGAGSYFTTTVGQEPVIVTRGLDGELRAFSNVCRHRAGPVASGCGTGRTLRCGYHGWTYGLDGRLLATPEFDGVENWSKDDVSLPPFRVDVWNNLVFVKLDQGGTSLAEEFAQLSGALSHDLTIGNPAGRKDWFIDCNWKVYVDNYLEGYHIPIVHPGLNREIDYARYRTEVRDIFSIQHSPIKPAPNPRLRAGDDAAPEAQFFWIFPNLMLNVYPDNFSTNLIVPLGPERTLTVFEWYFRDPDSPETKTMVDETIAFSDEIQLEDIKICEAVQRGLRSSTYSAGRYSVKRENGVHHFHGLLSKMFTKVD
jgi:choline monooxygenase